MKHLYLFPILMIFNISLNISTSQTIVKLTIPPQSDEPLQVTVLFEEEVPEGMPVVLGLIGYNISGGIQPYTYEWIQNGKVVGTGDIVVITPAKGDIFELKATDKNKCHSISSFSLKIIQKTYYDSDNNKNKIEIYPTLILDEIIHIKMPETEEQSKALVRIFDMKGVNLFETEISGSTSINHFLPEGIYFISVKTDVTHLVEKVIVKH